MEELEAHAPPAQRLVQRREHDVAHAGRHLPEDRAAVLEEHLRREEDRDSGAHAAARSRRTGLGEHEVVQPPDEREAGDLGRGAMTRDPVEEVLVVEITEAAPSGEQAVGEHPAHDGGHHRDEMPRAPQVGVLVGDASQRVPGRGHRPVERRHRRRDARAVERAADERGGLEDRRQRRHASARDEGARARGHLGRPAQHQATRRHLLVGKRLQEVDDQLQGTTQDPGERELAPGGIRLAGEQVVGGELPEPVVPTVAAAILEADRPRREHRVAPGLDRRRGIGRRPVELGVALAQQAEGVLVVAQPEVQAVFLDPAVRPPAAGPLATEPPPALVHGHRLELVLPPRFAEAPRRG